MSSAEFPSAAMVVLPCGELDASLEYFTNLGFRLHAIWPADQPRVAVLEGHGLRLRLDQDHQGDPGKLVLALDPSKMPRGPETAPNRTAIVFESTEQAMLVPEGAATFTISRNDVGAWAVGRASMRYRDLIPDRVGGRFIASHIHIPNGGPVPDYVHYHHVRFQLIFVRSGWVKVVYEDQGQPFVMSAGDCVLQPPLIRHRVLESSDDLEVVEIGCPAEHRTIADHDVGLPNAVVDPSRDFSGQRFVRHVAADAEWMQWHHVGFECQTTGIAEATRGLADVCIVRATDNAEADLAHSGEFLFLFALSGSARLELATGRHIIEPGDSVTVPANHAVTLAATADFEFLDVRLPA